MKREVAERINKLPKTKVHLLNAAQIIVHGIYIGKNICSHTLSTLLEEEAFIISNFQIEMEKNLVCASEWKDAHGGIQDLIGGAWLMNKKQMKRGERITLETNFWSKICSYIVSQVTDTQ